MINENRRVVARNSFIYAVAFVAGHAYVFITLPILTTNLSSDDFGIYIILVQIVTFMQMLSVALFGQALLRLHADFEGDEKKEFVGTMLLSAVLFSLIIAFAAYEWQLLIFSNLYPNVTSPIKDCFFFACLWSILVSIRAVAMTFLKGLEKPKIILFQNFLYGFTLIVTLLIIVGYFQKGLLGTMQSLLIAETFAQIILAFYLQRHVTLKPRIRHFQKAIKFSWPLLPGSLALLVYANLDRIILSQFVSLSDVGIYGFGLMLGNIAALAISSHISSYSPRLISFAKDNDPVLVSKLASQLLVDNIKFVAPIIGMLLLASSVLVALLGGSNDFEKASIVICGIAIGHLVRSLYLFYSNGLFLYSKSMAILGLNLVLLTFGAAIMYLLAKYTGIYGVAFATTIAYCIMIPLGKFVSKTWIQIILPTKKIIIAMFAFFSLSICELIILAYDFGLTDYEHWIIKLIECAIIFGIWGPGIYKMYQQYSVKKDVQ